MDDKMKDLLIDYIDGNLDGELLEFVQKQIEKNEAVAGEFERLTRLSDMMGNSPELEPDSTLRSDFLLTLEEELEKAGNSKEPSATTIIDWTIVWKVAAAVAVIAVSFLAGRWMWHSQNKSEQLSAIQQEMKETKELVLSSLQDQSSASMRLKGVNVAYHNTSVDAEVVRVLIKTMNEDENVNVRLAAVQALAKFSDQPGVTEALIHALEHQKEALVQIALINLMVELQEKKALDKLQHIINDNESIETVKNEAHMAVFKLS